MCLGVCCTNSFSLEQTSPNHTQVFPPKTSRTKQRRKKTIEKEEENFSAGRAFPIYRPVSRISIWMILFYSFVCSVAFYLFHKFILQRFRIGRTNQMLGWGFSYRWKEGFSVDVVCIYDNFFVWLFQDHYNSWISLSQELNHPMAWRISFGITWKSPLAASHASFNVLPLVWSRRYQRLVKMPTRDRQSRKFETLSLSPPPLPRVD